MGKKHAAIKAVEKGDVKASSKASAYRETAPVGLLGWFGKLADQPPLYAFAAGVGVAGLLRRDPRIVRTAARMAAAHWLGIRGKNAVKTSVDRTRPQMLIDEGRYEAGKGKRDEKAFNSFPSGHTVGAVAVARALVRDYPEYTVPAYALAGAAALARIAQCDHFVSDTAAGALIGWLSELPVPETA